MLEIVRQLGQFVKTDVKVHQAGDQCKLRDESGAQIVKGNVEILQTLKTSFFKIDLLYLIMSNVNFLSCRQLP